MGSSWLRSSEDNDTAAEVEGGDKEEGEEQGRSDEGEDVVWG